jgi:hypothetical protein
VTAALLEGGAPLGLPPRPPLSPAPPCKSRGTQRSLDMRMGAKIRESPPLDLVPVPFDSTISCHWTPRHNFSNLFKTDKDAPDPKSTSDILFDDVPIDLLTDPEIQDKPFDESRMDIRLPLEVDRCIWTLWQCNVLKIWHGISSQMIVSCGSCEVCFRGQFEAYRFT